MCQYIGIHAPQKLNSCLYCLPAKRSTLHRSVNRWLDDRQTEGWIPYASNSRPTFQLCPLCSVLTHQWVPLQLIFAKRSGGRRLEGARRVILEYLQTWLPNCRDSEVWLSTLTKSPSSSCVIQMSALSRESSLSSGSSHSLLSIESYRGPYCN